MTAKQWRLERGFKVFFRHSRVFLFQPSTGVCHSMPIFGGKWMDHDDLDREPWADHSDLLSPAQLDDFKATAAACYCYQGCGPCDFCQGRRPAPRSISVIPN